MTEILSQAPNEMVPLVIDIETAGVLMGFTSRQRSYAAATNGLIPTLKNGRRKPVPVARLAEVAGRSISAAEIRRAETIVRQRKVRAGACI